MSWGSKEKCRAYNKAYYARRRELEKARSAAWRAKNPGYRFLHNPERAKERHKRLREATLEIVGQKCAKCGFDDMRALQIDHKNSDGALERKTHGSSPYIAFRLAAKHPEKYQTLCANCNSIKRHEGKEWRRSSQNVDQQEIPRAS